MANVWIRRRQASMGDSGANWHLRTPPEDSPPEVIERGFLAGHCGAQLDPDLPGFEEAEGMPEGALCPTCEGEYRRRTAVVL
jgi:hypothetical protein